MHLFDVGGENLENKVTFRPIPGSTKQFWKKNSTLGTLLLYHSAISPISK